MNGLSPQLKQVFLIGDGKTRSGALRRYLVSVKATRLFLGVMDGYELKKYGPLPLPWRLSVTRLTPIYSL